MYLTKFYLTGSLRRMNNFLNAHENNRFRFKREVFICGRSLDRADFMVVRNLVYQNAMLWGNRMLQPEIVTKWPVDTASDEDRVYIQMIW